ncbi:TNT domain-containing protein [Mycobacterium malmoense]|uniref:TNT domain-containing protein n=1 Tax=Mycobacterium malmoense TaxID=1780 RepID=UPI0008F7F34C|nr:TNT domain-containing protein [Mycobacterium malmoense]OIN81859.1 hypothetical protein BMG05_05505 [Mycobacterium malmoense]
MQLRYISIPALVAEAGGDPWAINKSLQVGRPAQISQLAEAFHAAGRCTAEASAAFEEARRRFEASWNHEDGEHPINDSAEVQRVTTSLGAQSLQLPKVGVDLENIAAALAEAQRSAGGEIATLEGQLDRLDDLIGLALDHEKDANLSVDETAALNALIDGCEKDAIADTKAAAAELLSVRSRYSDCLQKSLNNLHIEGYDAAVLAGVDGDAASRPFGLQADELAAIRQVTNQAVVDQMAKVRAAQDALNKALATLYTHGPGSPEGEAAAASLSKLKADLARALDDLGKLPDYNNVDPSSISITPDGHFVFTYNVNGQPVQVVGQLKNGTGEFFDQATGTYYTFNGGKLAGMRTPDPGKVEATSEPLWSAITLAVGGAELKAGGAAAWQGLKTFFNREALEGLTSENVLPRALAGAQQRFEAAEQNLTTHGPLPDTSGQPVPGTHPGPPPLVEHTPPAAPGDIPPGEPHLPVIADSPPPLVPDQPPRPLPADSLLFHDYHPIEPGPEFTRADGGLIYPDDTLATKPYAIPGSVVPDANLQPGTILGRFGYPGGAYLAPDGTRFAELSLPPGGALKPYYQYVVQDPTALPPGWHIEQSKVAPWFHQPGGGQQYRIIDEFGNSGSVEELVRWGFLRRVN